MVDIALLGGLEPADEGGRERMVDALQERLDVRGGGGGLREQRLAEVGRIPGAVREIFAEEDQSTGMSGQ